MEACLAASCATATTATPANLFPYLVQTLLAAQCSLGNGDIYPPDRSEEIANSDREFDFIIVGSGTAGSVLANRLTEVEDWKVLLIEAGENPSYLSEIPAVFLAQLKTPQDYSYDIECEKFACLGSNNRRCKWPRGKALGGSSILNAMLHIFGNERDYNTWSENGNKGWSYDEVLPYFRKSITCGHSENNEWRSKYCGRGPMNIRYFNVSYSDLNQLFLDAARELNVPVLDAVNGDRYVGYGVAQVTAEKGRRNNAAKAFLSPIRDRSNLYVMKSTRADTVILEDGRAVGVRVALKNGKSIDVKASKEVIASAGSINTPQLLMLSGIGPEQHLREMGIPSVVDLPVGNNLQDHVFWAGVLLGFKNKSATPPPLTRALDDAYEYLMYNQGSFASASGHDFQGFVNVNDPTAKYPDIQFLHLYLSQWRTDITHGFLSGINFDKEIIQKVSTLVMQMNIIHIMSVLLNPKSRGEVRLRSKDPTESVRIRANYFTEQEDRETMLKSVDFVKKLVNTEIFKREGFSLQLLDIEHCRDIELDSKEYWECNLRHMSTTLFHPVGTAKMGPRSDPTTVVDSRLKVHGIQGLRVIDGSIMPTITSANTNAPIMMIAEKGADLIKEDWKTITKNEL
nr:PREDICTED: glucose dehydrogenase [FAD, quinone]-like [Linepithema humile]XP_012226924.1 PREDICTED: glucose dehydrogenase [FAD, quinone]-like [Linepithema humile]XP_012226925.1 PREDICTED: glucose dehydrogenase [FAD, quinone]-like [Linepithema humile]